MTNLDNLIRKEETKKSFQFVLTGLPMVIAGEEMQLAAKTGLMNYNWATGHLSDFGIVFTISALMYQITSALKLNKYIKIAASLLPPIIATIHEYAPLFNEENVTDNVDTALFWLGWATSIGGIKYLASRKAKKKAAQVYKLRIPASYQF